MEFLLPEDQEAGYNLLGNKKGREPQPPPNRIRYRKTPSQNQDHQHEDTPFEGTSADFLLANIFRDFDAAEVSYATFLYVLYLN